MTSSALVTDGTFSNVMGDESWLEAWQGAATDACGALVAPHDGSNAATYVYDEAGCLHYGQWFGCSYRTGQGI